MPTIAIPAAQHNGRHPAPGIRAVEAAGGRVRILAPGAGADALAGSAGLFIPDGADPQAATALAGALADDMPVLATGDGMYLLNSHFGGRQPSPVDRDCVDRDCAGDATEPLRHQIYLSPGSKVAAIIGSAGMFRVNAPPANHRLALREPQRAERLMSIAYQLDDGTIEGLESKEHSWVIAVQFLPERGEEVPAAFNSLFLGLVERADAFATGKSH